MCEYTSQNPYKLWSHLNKIYRVYFIGIKKGLKYKRERNDRKGDI